MFAATLAQCIVERPSCSLLNPRQKQMIGLGAWDGMMFATTLVKNIVDSTNLYGVRSSKRTAVIHNSIKDYIQSRNPRVSCVVEHRLSTRLGTFDVDVAIFEKNTPRLVACLLFKGLTSSIAKNNKNYEHNKIGEAVKAKSGMGDAKLVYLDVVPIRCPTYGAGEVIRGWESHEPSKVRTRVELLKEVANADRVRPLIDDVYTVSVNYNYQPDCKIELAEVVDESDLARFYAFIDGLVPS